MGQEYCTLFRYRFFKLHHSIEKKIDTTFYFFVLFPNGRFTPKSATVRLHRHSSSKPTEEQFKQYSLNIGFSDNFSFFIHYMPVFNLQNICNKIVDSPSGKIAEAISFFLTRYVLVVPIFSLFL